MASVHAINVRMDPAKSDHMMRLCRIRFTRELLRFETRRLQTATVFDMPRRVAAFERASRDYLEAIAS